MDKKYKILIIDEEENIDYYESIFVEYNIIRCTEPEKVFDVIYNNTPNLIIVDIAFSKICYDVELIKRIREMTLAHYIPIIIISYYHSQNTIIKSFEYGVDDFIIKPVNEFALLAKIKSILTLNRYGELLNEHNKLRKSFDNIVQLTLNMMDLKDPYTALHQKGVSKLAYQIGKQMGIDEEVCIECISRAGILHDIGKARVPLELLSKPSKLSKDEMDLVKIHSIVGFDLLSPIGFPHNVAQVVMQHHERLDGSGYPCGLMRNDILLETKILAVADVVDAMSNHRPYRPALGQERAIEEIESKSDILFDKDIVKICVEILKNQQKN